MTVPSVKHVYEEMLEHIKARELLSCILEKLVSSLYDPGTQDIVFKLLLKAVLCGNVDFLAEVNKIHPDLIWFENREDDLPLLHVAVLNSQVEVYRFLLGLSKTQFLLDTHLDNNGVSIVHKAAVLSPHRQLTSIPGPALQMQRELQWFKEVQKIAPAYEEFVINNDDDDDNNNIGLIPLDGDIEFVNTKGKTPGELFTEEHEELVRAGEKWMKEIAKSCTVVAALIVTMVFAAAFTIPGGYEEKTGIPINLHSNNYILFVVSDALSLFFSSTSILVFLGILTSLYREEDFLKSLPTKLIIGLSTLFASVAAMMVAFGATILLILRERLVWITMPIIMLASIPITFFVVLQFPLLIRILKSTYGPGIFR